MHSGNWPTKHGLHRVNDQRILHRNLELDVFHVLLEPAPDALFDLVHVLKHDGTLSALIKGQHGVAAKFQHDLAELAADLGGEHIAIESLTGEGTRDRSIGADEPEIEAELLRDGQGEIMAAAGDEHNFDAHLTSAAQRGHIGLGYLKLGVEQGTVDVECQQADGRRVHDRF